MKSLGVVRKFDSLGRIVIPKEIRLSLGFEQNPVEMLADEKGVYLRRYSPGCTFCKGMTSLVEFGGTHVCKPCASLILNK